MTTVKSSPTIRLTYPNPDPAAEWVPDNYPTLSLTASTPAGLRAVLASVCSPLFDAGGLVCLAVLDEEAASVWGRDRFAERVEGVNETTAFLAGMHSHGPVDQVDMTIVVVGSASPASSTQLIVDYLDTVATSGVRVVLADVNQVEIRKSSIVLTSIHHESGSLRVRYANQQRVIPFEPWPDSALDELADRSAATAEAY